jgi:hypothetical protein
MCYLLVANICAKDRLRKFILGLREKQRFGAAVTGVDDNPDIITYETGFNV